MGFPNLSNPQPLVLNTKTAGRSRAVGVGTVASNKEVVFVQCECSILGSNIVNAQCALAVDSEVSRREGVVSKNLGREEGCSVVDSGAIDTRQAEESVIWSRVPRVQEPDGVLGCKLARLCGWIAQVCHRGAQVCCLNVVVLVDERRAGDIVN